MSRRRLIQLLGALALLALVLATTELLFYFPLTPLSLDTSGETRLPAAPGRIRLLFVGDTLLADSSRRTLAYRGLDYPFDATRSLLGSADLAVGNLEGPISYSGRKARMRWSYRMDAPAALALRRAGFDVMNLANNHILDCGYAGLRESIALLRVAGLPSFGAGNDETEAHRPLLRDVGGVRVALLGYMAPYIGEGGRRHSMSRVTWGPGRGGTARGAPELIRRDVQLARSLAQVVVVSIHMGDRYQEQPTEYERDICRQAIDGGADAVIGHGTHIMGPVEIYQGQPIVYSVGNFAFGSLNVFARHSLVAVLEIDRRRPRVVGLQALPIFTMNANPWIDFQPKVLRGPQARRVLRRLLELSRPHAPGLRLDRGPDRLLWSGLTE